MIRLFLPGRSAGLFCFGGKKTHKTGQDDTMDRCIIFFVGAVASVATEAFWRGASRRDIALWGGIGMLLLRRVLLRYPYGDRALLCLVGALLLLALWLALLILQTLPRQPRRSNADVLTVEIPSFSYGLFRFLLIAPAYAVIEYLEARFGL